MSMLVQTDNLVKYFPIVSGLFRRKAGDVHACDGIDLSVNRGEWFGLVGESGCGKTTVAKTVLRLWRPTSGHIYFDVPQEYQEEVGSLERTREDPGRLAQLLREHDLGSYQGSRLKRMRRRMQMVHQDPSTSLNPRMSVKSIVAEPLIVHGLARGRELREKVADLLKRVGLTEEQMDRYPHEFSGGQRQRVAVARALATGPELVILDEPTSALDVSVQAQILNLLQELRSSLNLTYLYITHDLTVAESVCDRVAVMYLGKIVEVGPVAEVFQSPRHPYSFALLSSVPFPDPEKKRKVQVLAGEVPSPAHPPAACRFHPRCPRARPTCSQFEPKLEPPGGRHTFACWYPL